MLRQTVRRYVKLEEREDESPVGICYNTFYRGNLSPEDVNSVRVHFQSYPVKENLGEDVYFVSVRRHRHAQRLRNGIDVIRDAFVLEFSYYDDGNKLSALSRAVKAIDREMSSIGYSRVKK